MKRQTITKKPVPLEETLKEKQNFPWEEIDFEQDTNQKAFVDKILEKNQLNTMELELPQAYHTTLEKESHKQMMMIKIKCLIQG